MTLEPAKIFVEQNLVDEPYVHEIISRLPGVSVTWGDVAEFRAETLKQARLAPLQEYMLLLQKQYGPFIRACPGTQNYLCCGYQIIDFAANCTLGCHYCILQAYINFPHLVIYANIKELLAQLGVYLKLNADRVVRLGTGEFSDSLLWNKISNISNILIPLIGQQKNAILELKTKTTHIDQLEHLPHGGRVVISWSINSEECIRNYEEHTTNLEDRLQAAAAVSAWGYRIGFHFDPIIYYPGWEAGYREAVRLIFEHVEPEAIAWISLGAFRFMPKLKTIIAEKYPQDKFIYEEFILGADKKMRYFKPLRIKMYKVIQQAIREFAPHACIYLCMESPQVWQEVFGYDPSKYGGLSKLLDGAINAN